MSDKFTIFLLYIFLFSNMFAMTMYSLHNENQNNKLEESLALKRQEFQRRLLYLSLIAKKVSLQTPTTASTRPWRRKTKYQKSAVKRVFSFLTRGFGDIFFFLFFLSVYVYVYVCVYSICLFYFSMQTWPINPCLVMNSKNIKKEKNGGFRNYL